MISTLMTVKNIAELLVCSERTVHRLIRDRQYRLPTIKLRGRLLFDESDVRKWLEEVKKKSGREFYPNIQ